MSQVAVVPSLIRAIQLYPINSFEIGADQSVIAVFWDDGHKCWQVLTAPSGQIAASVISPNVLGA